MTALPQPLAPDIRVEYISPQIAEAYLEHNVNNRSLSQLQVVKYAHAMKVGDWQLSDPIKFDTYGRLIDGQHRLAAVVQSGATVPIFVVRGLDPSAQDVIDTGRARSAGDAIKLHGYKHYNLLASTAKLLIAADNGWVAKVGNARYPRPITTSEILRYVEENPRLISAATAASVDRGHINMQPTALCYGRYVLSNIDELAARNFFKDLCDMRTNGVGDPRATLLKRLAHRDRNDTLHDSIFLLFRTWNAVRAGKPLRQLKIINSDVPIPTPI